MSWMLLSLDRCHFRRPCRDRYSSQGGLPTRNLCLSTWSKRPFLPFVVGFILCAVLAATINAMSSQVLVLSSNITEDFYKRIFRKTASSGELLIVARVGVIIVSLIALAIAYGKISTSIPSYFTPGRDWALRSAPSCSFPSTGKGSTNMAPGREFFRGDRRGNLALFQ